MSQEQQSDEPTSAAEHGSSEMPSAGVSQELPRDEVVRALRAAGVVGPDVDLLSVTTRSIGTGQAAESLLVTARWSGPGPKSFLAKLPSADPDTARAATSLGIYEREARFYDELAPLLDVDVPAHLGTMWLDGKPMGLLLEDLSELSPGDQCSDQSLASVRRMREQLVRLQAASWNDESVAAKEWLHRRLGVPLEAAHERMVAAWADNRDRFVGEFDQDELDLIDRFVDGADEWSQGLRGPFALTHHDYRADNIMFDPAGTRTVVLDWQTVGWGVPMFDLAYLLCTSLTPQRRRALERDEVGRHVDDLMARGVEWAADLAWTAYREASFAVLHLMVPALATAERTARGDDIFRRLLRCGARMALDLDAEEFLTRKAE